MTGQHSGHAAILAFAARLWALLGRAVVKPALVGLAVVTVALVGGLAVDGLGATSEAEVSSGPAWSINSAPNSEEFGPGPSDGVPNPLDSEGERGEFDDERENDLTLLATLAPTLLASGEYTFTPARLFQPRFSVPQSIDKPPRG